METLQGEVVRLDRGYPLVELSDGRRVRCEHAAELVKEAPVRAVIGDRVDVSAPDGHEKAVITRVHERARELVRKDPAELAVAQVLAANFDLVIVAQPLAQVNIHRLERELVLAHQTGAQVVVVLTKADLADDVEQVGEIAKSVRAHVGAHVSCIVVSQDDESGVEQLRSLIAPDKTAVLIGRSGVGKSSLINLLVGGEVQETGSVREGDGKGRHTTVSREIVNIPTGGRIVDMPGVRGLGMWEADEGIGAAFADIEELAASCRFRDCRHIDEPGCAVLAAVAQGALAPERVESYRELKAETVTVRKRHEQARHMQGKKVSDEKAQRKHADGRGGSGSSRKQGKGPRKR